MEIQPVNDARNNENAESSMDQPNTEENEDVTCGIGRWRCKSLEKYRTLKCFMPLFSLIVVIQGTYYTYLITCVSTLEKRYLYSSKMSGNMLIADNIACLILSPIVGYLGKRMNKVTLIALGMLSCSLSCFLTAMPYFIYGSADDQVLASVGNFTSLKKNDLEFCSTDNVDKCKSEAGHTTIWPAYVIIWLASFLNGVGYTALTILGLVFVDDNVKKAQAPFYFSCMSALRLLGPTGAYILSSVVLSLPEDPSSTAIHTKSDPRFIGAWWIGFLVIGSALFIFTLPLFLFPGELASIRVKRKVVKNEKSMGLKEQVIDVKNSILRLCESKVWLLDTIGAIFGYIGGVGYHMNLPKYLETQYHKSASDAAFMTGAYSISSTAVGMLVSGFVVSYFKPRPKYLILYMIIVTFATKVFFLAKMFLGCPQSPIFALQNQLMDPCNSDCHCNSGILQPVCSSDGQTTFISPCYAGCEKPSFFEKATKNTTFHSCVCDASYSPFNSSSLPLINGYCDVQCDNFVVYMVLTAISRFIGSTDVSVGFILRLRSIREEDKPFAAGLAVTVHGLFAAIPGPIIFGAIADAACALWKTSCNEKGNCWIYDSDKFRIYLHGATLFFKMCSLACDFFILYYSSTLKNIYDDHPPEETTNQESKTDTAQEETKL